MNFSKLLKSQRLLNPLCEHVSMFTIEEGETIEKGDSVVVDTNTLLARKPTEGAGYLTAGIAAKVISNEYGVQSVICVDGIHLLYNTCGDISEADIGKDCYFLDTDNVTLDGTNKIKAGHIEAVELSDDPADIEDGADRRIFIKMDILQGRYLKW